MLVYKLTNSLFQTYNKTQWGEGVEHTASGKGKLCSLGWLHAYEDPRIAVLMNPVHADFNPYILWEADGDVGIRDGQLKLGCTRLKTIRKMKPPEITSEQRVLFAMACAKQVYKDEKWNRWADKWISGEDRSGKAAEAEAADAAKAAEVAAWTADTWEASAVSAAEAAWAAKSSTAEWAAAAAAKSSRAAAAWAAWAVWAAETVDMRVALASEWAERATIFNEITFDVYAAMEKAGITL